MSENKQLHLAPSWWLDRGMRESAAEMDQLFHRMLWNGVNQK